MDGSLSATFDQERSRARLGAIIVPLVALLVGLGVGYVVANRGDTRGPESAEVGPTSTKNGVPVGYARTRQGAVAAATNYELVRSGQLLLRESEYLAAVDVMAARSWRSEGSESAKEAVTKARSAFGDSAKIESRAMRHKVARFSSSNATIELWLISLVDTSGEGPVTEVWSRVAYDLVWESDDWRVADAQALEPVIPQPFRSHTTQTDEDSPLSEYEGYE